MERATSAAVYHWKLIVVSDLKERNDPAGHWQELCCFILKRKILSLVVTEIVYSLQFCKKIQIHLNF